MVRQLYLIRLGEERKLGNRDERRREPKPPSWAIYFKGFAAVGLNKRHNQLYLIRLGEERKLGNRDERRREPKPPSWAIYFKGFAAVGLNKGHNQPYLIRLGEERKLGNRDERRREPKPPSWAIFQGFCCSWAQQRAYNQPYLIRWGEEKGREQKRASRAIPSRVLLQLDMNVQQIVWAQLFSRPKPILWAAFFKGFAAVGLEEGNPGRRPQALACFKSGDATRHLCRSILNRMACGVALALAIGGPCRCRRPPPRGQKIVLFLKNGRRA